jgi:23S rRNA (guanine745-N1)-methyltransferase
MLLCPLDAAPLSRTASGLSCPNGHSFDFAKTGYVNLLPVQNKHSKDPGDSKAMVSARREFLESGLYSPIAKEILRSRPAELLSRAINVLDAGCGEGYYTARIHAANGEGSQVFGIDISKWAIQAASKRSKDIAWIVGSNARIPLPNDCLDWLVCTFGFPIFEEFLRVLKPGGWLLMVDPGADHLLEMRRILYPTLKPFTLPYGEQLAGFRPAEVTTARYLAHLSSQTQISQLLSMTPHQHKSPKAGRDALSKLERLDVTVDVCLRWYQKL